MTDKTKKEHKLPPELAKEGVGMHRKPTCVEIVMAQQGMPFLKANAIVKCMTKDQKSDVETKDPAKVNAAVAAATEKHLEDNKATQKTE